MEITSFKEIISATTNSTKKIKCIWWVNIGVDEVWKNNTQNLLPQLTNIKNKSVVNRTELISLLLADSQDIVILREPIPKEISNHYKLLGFKMPEILLVSSHDEDPDLTVSDLILENSLILNSIRQLTLQYEVLLIPYAVTCKEEEIARLTGCKLIGATANLTAWVNSKVNARLIAKEINANYTEGYICENIIQVKEAIFKLTRANCNNRIVVKDAYGASGKGLFIIESQSALDYFLAMLDRKSNENKKIEVIVEKWYEKYLDINYQVFIGDDGTITYLSPKIQLMNNSIYIGSEYPIENMLDDKQKLLYEETAHKIGKYLYKKGYRGLASIDSIIASDGTIYPIIEINGRFSLSTYISFVPVKLGLDNYYRTKYFNVDKDITLSSLMEELIEKELIYLKEKGEGVIVYSFCEGKQSGSGRVFIMMVAKCREQLSYIQNMVDNIFD
ncbi:ATP-binding protein [Alkaliphilus peptidifermentans]|uniref:Carbamoyl-phosphate synthase L chain, ATP binding domain n=1 Tax=Alkaliphilus peptidifermentans DSM 18978 TaxID=1120976 RepID=A0A1G5L9A6_9FIRM|nr:ATP-grasp domain-containing protein [Alkaliphilus peptidifermentans]SCZ09475.1 Carbamoyl-phosphate synthase L chain, ATP binding domain [Alkaliphilus peptidifermentans DSM 18978]